MSVFLSRIVFSAARSLNSKCFSTNLVPQFVCTKRLLLCANNDLFSTTRHSVVRNVTTEAMQPVTAIENSNISLKKKTLHKKADVRDLKAKEGHYLTFAYATANSYDLKNLKEALVQQKLYEPGT